MVSWGPSPPPSHKPPPPRPAATCNRHSRSCSPRFPAPCKGLALPTASQSASATPQWVTDLGNLSTFLGGAVTGPYTFPGVLPPSGVPYLLGIQSVLVTQNGQGVSALLGKIGGKPITGALAPLAEFALHTPILGSEGLGGGSVSAGIGRAGLVGKLSVPQGWTVAAPEIPSPAAALQATRLAAAPIAAPDGAGALLGGMALSGLAGRAAAGSTGHPIGSAAAPAGGAAAAAVEDLATEANIFVIPAMDD